MNAYYVLEFIIRDTERCYAGCWGVNTGHRRGGRGCEYYPNLNQQKFKDHCENDKREKEGGGERGSTPVPFSILLNLTLLSCCVLWHMCIGLWCVSVCVWSDAVANSCCRWNRVVVKLFWIFMVWLIKLLLLFFFAYFRLFFK